ncbi:nickel pincer cofactor biosynthesis protein LarC [Synechocystis sp. PCC 7509]|uniref:nickel pincer cofactor biosynthesis protein LarC n=1 Tax=Synechocystis sp. PCC 7509 TaxID=927677 RepID=UPI0002AC7CFD|nr:nickel pincer cofactor biosynthesis protein LarC [Synechocystis sp. PCC 7509]
MKLAYLECPTGIAGDMCLGAIADLGVPVDYLRENLNRLGIAQDYQLRVESVHRQGQRATKVHVDLTHHQHHGRHLPEIEQQIIDAQLPPQAEAWSLAVFRRLAEAEGAVHGIESDRVHFHEVGAIDAIVDIVGTCLGLDWLGIEKLYCSPFPTGGGNVRAAHGQLKVPVPAVLKLWEMRQCPVYSNGIEKELVTPTGAAIATTLAASFGSPPAMTLQQVGLGAGSQDLALPNILRLWIGETNPKIDSNPAVETVAVLETQIDDLSPQAIGYVFEALFEAGAVDVFTQAIAMKKSRLGTLLTVICQPEKMPDCEAIIFKETTTLGIRRYLQQRRILGREIQQVDTDYGVVKVKVAWAEKGKISNVQPEYEDCAKLARQHQVSWREIQRIAVHCWYAQKKVI